VNLTCALFLFTFCGHPPGVGNVYIVYIVNCYPVLENKTVQKKLETLREREGGGCYSNGSQQAALGPIGPS